MPIKCIIYGINQYIECTEVNVTYITYWQSNTKIIFQTRNIVLYPL